MFLYRSKYQAYVGNERNDVYTYSHGDLEKKKILKRDDRMERKQGKSPKVRNAGKNMREKKNVLQNLNEMSRWKWRKERKRQKKKILTKIQRRKVK